MVSRLTIEYGQQMVFTQFRGQNLPGSHIFSEQGVIKTSQEGKEGRKPTSDDIARFIRDDVVFDLETIAGMKVNDLIPTVFVKFFDEEQTEAFLAVIKNGVLWPSFGGKTVRGWRTDGKTLEVKIKYALHLTEDFLKSLMIRIFRMMLRLSRKDLLLFKLSRIFMISRGTLMLRATNLLRKLGGGKLRQTRGRRQRLRRRRLMLT